MSNSENFAAELDKLHAARASGDKKAELAALAGMKIYAGLMSKEARGRLKIVGAVDAVAGPIGSAVTGVDNYVIAPVGSAVGSAVAAVGNYTKNTIETISVIVALAVLAYYVVNK